MFGYLLKNKHLKDFLNESAIHGLRLLLYYTRFKYARFIWTIFIFAVIVWTHFIILTLIVQYIQQPTEVHMSTNMVHVSNTPFPGVAVCSANKLSREKILSFAEKVFEQQQRYKPYYLARTIPEMAHYLLNLKGFYIYPHDNEPLNLTVLHRLDKIFTIMFNTTDYPIRDYLKILAPDCRHLVIRGTIYGKEINTRDYFNKRLTSSSVCCMFNYNRRGYSIDENTREADNRFAENAEKIKFQSNSILNSIQFVLRSTPEDFTITEFHNTAFQLFIFPREDYATIQSNRIGEILVDYNTIVEVPIEPEFFGSTQSVRQFAPEVRNCYFPDEGQKLLNQSYYSIDECLLICRMDSMLKYCGCVTPPMAATNKTIIYCNFLDIPCLMNWRAIWYGSDTFEYVHENGKDIQDDFTTGHRCPQCLPNCNGVDFNLEVNDMTMRPIYGQAYSHGILKGLTNTKPLAIVKLYFKQRFVLSTEMDIVGDWVVLLNRFGGIMSLMYGFSIISYIEIIYFATGKFFAYHLDSWKRKMERKLSTLSNVTENIADSSAVDEPPPAYNLCWKELKPKQPMDMEIFRDEIILNLYKRE
ncbi:sodium channel protein Nach [Lucilia cuprina]|uniref:sodium channel protein Nach n=1 Tax=Lucilia cuprina TaxID=7375 RepID=UPI001F06EA3D|nr:sodium channel protein Nach [Lucilia cuprina]